jgi:hypothetical protein
MELSIKPSPTNSYPLHGILVKDASAAAWLTAIKQMSLQLNDIRVYPIPGLEANTIWGCLILCHHKTDSRMAGKHELCQLLTPHLLIPEKAVLYPALDIREVEKLVPSQLHIFHPEFGLAELTEELNLKELIAEPELRSYHVTQPEKPVFVPMQVRSFQVKPLPPEEVLKQMEEHLFPKTEEMPKDELTKVEQARLKFYEVLYGKKDKDGKPVSEGAEGLAGRYGEKLGALLGSLIPKNSGLSERMQKDFEELQRRNQAEIEKLMELFRNNPDEALKYAIPLDENGSVRGGESLEFNLSKRWSDFSLGNIRAGSGSGSVDFGEEYRRQLRKQYNDTAEDLIRKKEYEKAAFVYMKLLKDVHRAAGTLEEGKLYQEAATIYLKHANNKQKAAECYEKGKMINDAIDLYKELKQDEKVGDLYVSINRRKQANVHYEMVADDYSSKDQYLKASLIYRHKMLNEPGSQTLLLEGWRKQKDAFNCLHNYLNNVEDLKTLKLEINRIYHKELTDVNSPVFLQVIKHEYNKQNELAEPIKDMAYEIIASQLAHNSSMVNELKEFNKKDKEITKDLQRFMQRKRK